MKLWAIALYFKTPWDIEVKTGAGTFVDHEHMTMNILADESKLGAFVNAMMIHKDKGKPQYWSVEEITSDDQKSEKPVPTWNEFREHLFSIIRPVFDRYKIDNMRGQAFLIDIVSALMEVKP